jgi:hypothetical protein
MQTYPDGIILLDIQQSQAMLLCVGRLLEMKPEVDILKYVLLSRGEVYKSTNKASPSRKGFGLVVRHAAK